MKISARVAVATTLLIVIGTVVAVYSYTQLARATLLKTLPKQVQYQTFNRILEYLESSNKIVYDGRKIVWIFPDNPKLEKLLETSVRLR